MGKATKKLTAKESDAITFYCNLGSETHNDWCASYLKANYSKCGGWQSNAVHVLHKDHVQAAIKARKEAIEAQMDVTAAEIIHALRKLAGLDPGATNLNNAEKIRALELLGRNKGIWKDKLEIKGFAGRKPEDTKAAIERSRLKIRNAG